MGDTGIGCVDCRDAISARLDGEDLPGEAEAVDAHLATCAECRAWSERAVRVTRLTRTRPAEDVPDLVAAVVSSADAAALVPRRVRWVDAVRVGLGMVGVAQLALAVSGIVAAGAYHGGDELAGATTAHFAHESSAWNLALAVGFLWAATAARRAAGLVPVILAFVGVLTVLSAIDVIDGRVEPSRLLGHGLVVIGLLLLLAFDRLAGTGGGGSTRGARTDRDASPTPAERRLVDTDTPEDGETLRPTARAA